MLLSAPINVDRLKPAGPPRTTGAGRFAIPVALMDGQYEHLKLDLVLDADTAEQLHAALDRHLAGTGATAPAQPRSRGELQ